MARVKLTSEEVRALAGAVKVRRENMDINGQGRLIGGIMSHLGAAFTAARKFADDYDIIVVGRNPSLLAPPSWRIEVKPWGLSYLQIAVAINGRKLAEPVDPFALAKDACRPYILEVPGVAADNGVVSIELTGNACINGIEVVRSAP